MSKFRLNVILDLDQTCISGENLNEFDLTKYEKKARMFTSHNMDDEYIIYERPNLQAFLDYLFNNFNVSVWTAASFDYGMFIIENIILADEKRELDFYLHSKHCTESKKKLKKCCKDLDMLYYIWQLPGYSKENTIIIDDLNEVHSSQPLNCIHIKEFEFTKPGSEKDQELLKVKDYLTRLVS